MSYHNSNSTSKSQSAEKLTEELNKCIELQNTMKEANAYWRKYGTCVGAPGITERQLNDNAIYAAGRLDFVKPSDGRTVREHQPKAPAKDMGAR